MALMVVPSLARHIYFLGTVMLAALPNGGVQLILAFLGYDIASTPKTPRHRRPSTYELIKLKKLCKLLIDLLRYRTETVNIDSNDRLVAHSQVYSDKDAP